MKRCKAKQWHNQLITLLLLLSITCFAFVSPQKPLAQFKQIDEKNIPIILIPGTNSDENRFDTFMQKMMTQVGPRDSLKIQVQEDGSLKWSGNLTKKSINPFIVIGFADNSESAVKKQSEWIQIALDKVHECYNFDRYDAIGHSNGGLAWTLYLENNPSTVTDQMAKLITIGTPFNETDLADNPYPSRTNMTATDTFEQLVSAKAALPRGLDMVAIAGDYDRHDDGIVPVTSALASNIIFKGQVSHYQEKIVSGDQAQHSDLIDNEQVVQTVVDTLY